MPTTHQDILIQIAGKFGQVLPDSREKCLIVILLYLKIEEGLLDAAFTERDLDATMEEVEEYLARPKAIRPERPTRELTGYFLNYDRRSNRYKLSPYGTDFARLIVGKVKGAMNPDSLRLTFRNTFQLNDRDQVDIESLVHWHQNQFLQTSKRTIEGVLDGLETSMNAEFEALEALMESKGDDFRELLKEYKERFDVIRAKSDDMRETIEARQEVITTLKGLEARFERDRDQWERYLVVERSILDFFRHIDERLASVYVHVDHAVKRLNLLYENFRYKRAYRLQLERFLQRLLAESTLDGDRIVLPAGMAPPEMPSMVTRFKVPPDSLEIGRRRTVGLETDVDAADVLEGWERNRLLLERQDLVDTWTSRIEELVLQANEMVDVSRLLYNIVEEGVAAEVALSVASNLLWRFGDRSGFVLAVNPPTVKETGNESMVLWKMQIGPSHS